jgi:prepilin-type N-terminal cleavage/methylation domain-containing protein
MKREAFSLVELMLVVVIMGIVGALILINMSTSEDIDAHTEARRYVRAVYSVRNAWIAYMADRHIFLGVPDYSSADYKAVLNSLDMYADRAGLAADAARYGNIKIETVPVTSYYSHIFLGFDGTGDFGGDADRKDDTLGILDRAFGTSYNLTSKDLNKSDMPSLGVAHNLMLRVW